MLPRRLRLSRRGIGGMRRALRRTSHHFSIAYDPGTHHGGATVVVPKKAVSSAVGRNRMKRRIRPLLLPYAESGALAVYVRPGVIGVPFSKLREELISLLGTLSVRHTTH